MIARRRWYFPGWAPQIPSRGKSEGEVSTTAALLSFVFDLVHGIIRSDEIAVVFHAERKPSRDRPFSRRLFHTALS